MAIVYQAGRRTSCLYWRATLFPVAPGRPAPDALLSTTRAVRKRLDFSRPVPRQVIMDCIALSQQAPTASNGQTWRWVVVDDAATRGKTPDLHRGAGGPLLSS